MLYLVWLNSKRKYIYTFSHLALVIFTQLHFLPMQGLIWVNSRDFKLSSSYQTLMFWLNYWFYYSVSILAWVYFALQIKPYYRRQLLRNFFTMGSTPNRLRILPFWIWPLTNTVSISPMQRLLCLVHLEPWRQKSLTTFANGANCGMSLHLDRALRPYSNRF